MAPNEKNLNKSLSMNKILLTKSQKSISDNEKDSAHKITKEYLY